MSQDVLSRRSVLAGGAAGCFMSSTGARAESEVRAIAFDAFPIFDPRPIAALVKARLPEKGEALASLWSAKLFATTWLETAADRYQPFEIIAASTLRTSAVSLAVDLTTTVVEELVASYGQLTSWPDIKPALAKLSAAGIRLVLLSNLGERTLRSNMERAELTNAFQTVLSTDRVKRFKPSPAAYAMATEAFGLPKSAIAFAAFGGWDAVGATWFGYRTAWINRMGAPTEPFPEHPAIVTRGIEGVLQLAGLN